jgi:uncharacterized protein
MKRIVLFLFLVTASLTLAQVDPQLAAYMDTIGAIDNHAHVYAPDVPNDLGYDALRCEELPPDQGPPAANFRFGADTKAAWQALYGVQPATADEAEQKRPAMIENLRKAHGDNYYDWVLQKSGVDIVFANRVSMSPALRTPHFRWVPYVDAFLFPLNNDVLKAANPDRTPIFNMEEQVRKAYFQQAGITQLPPSLDEYLDKVVRAVLRQQKDAGAVAVKFEAAYLRKLDFAPASHDAADAVYRRGLSGAALPASDYKLLQDYIFHEVALEAGKLGMPVHIHTGAGCGQFFDDSGSDPMLLINVFNDATLRGTKFVMLHGGTPFNRHVTTLILKPNVYVDTSVLEFEFSPAQLAEIMRPWLEEMPERILFGTDADFFGPGMAWVETTWLGAHHLRQALGIVLTQMVHDGVITQARAKEIAQRVLRGNAAELYHVH